jgi:hypothetical protein
MNQQDGREQKEWMSMFKVLFSCVWKYDSKNHYNCLKVGRGGQKSYRGGELDQSTLYACMKR